MCNAWPNSCHLIETFCEVHARLLRHHHYRDSHDHSKWHCFVSIRLKSTLLSSIHHIDQDGKGSGPDTIAVRPGPAKPRMFSKISHRPMEPTVLYSKYPKNFGRTGCHPVHFQHWFSAKLPCKFWFIRISLNKYELSMCIGILLRLLLRSALVQLRVPHGLAMSI